MVSFLFNDWEALVRAFGMTILAYFAMVIFLRISGKRTLSKMNAFDFIITIALGSSLATVALSRDISLAEGALVIFLLIFLQFLISWTSVRSRSFKRAVSSRPTLLLYKGSVLEDTLKGERITKEELYLVAREKGLGSLEEADVMVLETTGSITVIGSKDPERDQTLADVKRPVSP
jgi:uncharacterized membrane protein YcaP (DUF421 family)